MALTSNGVGTCGADDNQAQAGHLIVHPTTVKGDVTHTLTSEGADASEGGTGRGTPIVVLPLAIRGRDGGAQLEIGPEGGPYNALRAGDGGSSRQSLVAITAPKVAATLTAGTSTPGVSAPGRRQEDDHNLVALDLRNAARSTDAGESTGLGIREDGPSYTVSATLRAVPGVATETVVRRLTELECGRLQGYPDGWTDDQSGAAQYRQLGNSVAVPVVEWIARRLVMVDGDLP